MLAVNRQPDFRRAPCRAGFWHWFCVSLDFHSFLSHVFDFYIFAFGLFSMLKNQFCAPSETSETFLDLILFVSKFFKKKINFSTPMCRNVQLWLQPHFWFTNSFQLKLSRKFSLTYPSSWEKSGIPKRLGKLFRIPQNVRSRSPKFCFLQTGQLACRSSVIPLKLAVESCSARCMQLCSLSPPSSTRYFSQNQKKWGRRRQKNVSSRPAN